MFVRSFAAPLLLAAFVAGCGRSRLEQAEISGKVLYQGKPLPGGVITFLAPRGYTATAVIDPQGNYQIKAPVGEVQIGVDNTMLDAENLKLKQASAYAKQGMLKPPAEVASKQKQSQQAITGTYVFLPKKYTAPNTSGLTYTVKPGTQTHDVELSDKSSPPPAASGQ